MIHVMRVIWAVGADEWWPREMYVLFAAEREARRHAERAAYAFSVFPVVVYDRYPDVPAALRARSRPDGLSTMSSDEREYGRMLIEAGEASPEQSPPEPVCALGGWDTMGEPEVWVVYSNAHAAQCHFDDRDWAMEQRTLPVFERYEDCPTSQRYLTGGQALSQLVRARPA
jgi:hypothetical protein